ncbi:glycoside hydrolase family 3 C-terminal domain-containing protein [Salinisphaera sp. SPP-AMP-43]
MYKFTGMGRAVMGVAVLSFGVGQAYAAPPRTGLDVEARVGAMVDNMTLAEQINYTRVDDGHMLPPLAKFDLPGTIAYDSSMGVHVDDKTFGAQYPSQSALSATWNINRAKEFGLAIGYETRAAGGQQMLSPGMNLYRMPYGGRQAEYISGEDPFLGAVMGAASVNGIQTQGIMAGAKHWLMNEQEANRRGLNVHVSERAMRELYMPGFESLAKNANIAAIMCGFNQINDEYACDNHHLITDVLKGEWGYEGFVLSDFNSIHDPFQGAWAGTDLDMPTGLQFTEANLMPYVWSGQLVPDVIKDKARRNLRALVRYRFDEGLPVVTGLTEPGHGARAALDVAREGIVLLKNSESQGQPLLPLDQNAKIAVVGDLSVGVPTSPSGTAWSPPDSYVNELSGLKQLARSENRVDYLQSLSLSPQTSVWYQPAQGGSDIQNQGLKAEYFSNTDLSGEPVITRIEPGVDWDFSSNQNVTAFGTSSVNGFSPTGGSFSARFTGQIKPTISGRHVFKVRADGPFKLWVNGRLLIDFDGEVAGSGLTSPIAYSGRTQRLRAGQTYDVRLEYQRTSSGSSQLGSINGIQMSWASLAAPQNLDQYDAVYIAAGLGNEYEGEGSDHEAELPEYQSNLIRNLSRANPNTIVVLHAGGGVKMLPWAKKAGAILHAWYPGQQGGQALAEIIYGDVNPSGKLPISLAKHLEDNPAYSSYHDVSAYQGDNAKTDMTYSEGVFLGYRGYDENGVKPLYPFGFGLSYTTFSYSGLKLTPHRMTPGATVEARFTVTNTGSQAGYETAELYVHPRQSTIPRPRKELKGFAKVYLQPGESKQVTIPLNGRSLAYYQKDTDSWDIDPGRYVIKVGGSSDALSQRAPLIVSQAEQLKTSDSNPLPKPLQEAVQVNPQRAY